LGAVFGADVAAVRDGGAARGRDGRDGLRRDVAQVVDDELRAEPGEMSGVAAAEAAPRAGDDDDFAGQRPVGALLLRGFGAGAGRRAAVDPGAGGRRTRQGQSRIDAAASLRSPFTRTTSPACGGSCAPA
jgi:hypothetical protein